MSQLRRQVDVWARGAARYPSAALARLHVTPNQLTLFGFVLSLGVGALLGMGHFPWAAALMLASGVFDLLDGALARLTGQATKFGAVLDSTLDRASEAAILGGLMYFYVQAGDRLPAYLAFAFLAGSFLVSYVRARAEAAGLTGEVGVLPRGERVVLLAIALFLNIVPWVLGLLTTLAFITVFQRLGLVWRQSKG